MTVLANITIGAPVNAATTPQLGVMGGSPERVSLQANFTVSAAPKAGSSVSAWVQTTLDEGLTWSDASNFTFGAVSERVLETICPPVAVPSPMVLTDGTLAANSSTEAVIGPTWRVKYTVIGQYPNGATLRIDMN